MLGEYEREQWEREKLIAAKAATQGRGNPGPTRRSVENIRAENPQGGAASGDS